MNYPKKGQATIELLLIFAMLFIILGVSVKIASDQRLVVNEKQIQLAASRNAQLVATVFSQVGSAPIGTRVRAFIPPAPSPQTIYIRSGFVEIHSSQIVVFAPIPNTSWSAGPFMDGNTIHVSRDENTVHAE